MKILFVENFKLNDQGMKKSDLTVCLELPESQLYHALSPYFKTFRNPGIDSKE
jgi:hypothetical protein